jgi:nucleoside-diphosphate-sugar epimerase
MLGDRVMPRILAGKGVQLIGDIDQPHSWTAPIDVARTIVTAAADERGWGRAWHAPSNPPRSQREAVADLAAAAGIGPVKTSTVPGALLWGLGLFQPMIRELKETDYQRTRAYLLDDSAARATFALEPTPWSDLLSGMVAHYQGAQAVAA